MIVLERLRLSNSPYTRVVISEFKRGDSPSIYLPLPLFEGEGDIGDRVDNQSKTNPPVSG